MTDPTEMLARAMCEQHQIDEFGSASDRHIDECWHNYINQVSAALAALNAAGYEIRRIRAVHRTKP